jgi:hypothetical protein
MNPTQIAVKYNGSQNRTLLKLKIVFNQWIIMKNRRYRATTGAKNGSLEAY